VTTRDVTGDATDDTVADHYLAVAVAAARAGGAVLIEGLHRPKQIELKSERASIVTWADVTSQAAIFEVIGDAFPDHAILGEEGIGGASDSDHTWIVDPLDGTSNYAHGLPFACVSVALRDPHGVVVGAIFEPFRGELFTAARGRGAWLGSGPDDRERLAVSSADSLARALVCTGIQSDDPAQIEAYGRRIVALYSSARGTRALGSPALCLAYVAAGRIDAFLERDATYAWDVAAGSLLITEAGGRCEDLDGGPLNLGAGVANVLGSNGAIHDDLAQLIAVTDHPFDRPATDDSFDRPTTDHSFDRPTTG
jgi:myo-inositol-1(or 4)-monophosphatase